jgi:hypothetical protein
LAPGHKECCDAAVIISLAEMIGIRQQVHVGQVKLNNFRHLINLSKSFSG